MADKKPTLRQLQATYDKLAEQSSGFDAETKRLLKERDDANKAFLADRKKQRGELMGKKLAITQEIAGLQAALQTAQNAGEKAEATAAAAQAAEREKAQADAAAEALSKKVSTIVADEN